MNIQDTKVINSLIRMNKNKQGLTTLQAEKNLAKYGLNEIKDVSKTTTFKILLRQIKSNFIIYLLLGAMLLSFFVGKSVTAYTILVIILTVIILGFVQEFRSEKAISSLKDMLIPVSTVIRNGKEHEISSLNLVPDDIIILRNGDKIPADCIILEEKELRVNESVLTGESKEIRKKALKKDKKDENFIYMGSYIVNGRCVARILHTGMNTKFGKIAELISTTEKELPLQLKINRLTKYICIIGLVFSLLTGSIMLFREPVITYELFINVLILIIALSVSAFPESFPVVLITTLSSGAYKMAKKNAIVNRMSIIETLGETTVICSDKTGTITKGEMTAKKIYVNGSFYDISGTGYSGQGSFLKNNKKIDIKKQQFYGLLFNNFLLCNDARIEKIDGTHDFKISGSPTEAALLVLAAKSDFYKEDMANHQRLQEIPFNSDRKMMSVLCKINQEKKVYAKGAPEYLLKYCTHIQTKNKIVKLTDKRKKEILKASNSMSKDSFRTLAFAYKTANTTSKNNLEKDLIFSGLVGLEDPPREEVKESIRDCHKAGIKVKMITGDNKETARSISKQIGLNGKIMLGEELENITDDELGRIISSVTIFARVKPEHKLRIIKALKSNGEIVTMTGDGVNDAPALKEAHIGVAMGKNGTDVSRSVADLTLKDDHFSTIVLAVSEGRTIFKNIRKFVTFQLSCNFAELFILFLGVILAPLLGWHIPLLLALQILFMNLVTADLPAVSLGLNRASKDVMTKKPRRNSNIFNGNTVFLIVLNGGLMMLFVLLSYFLTYNILGRSVEYSRTVALLTLIALEIVSGFNFRSFNKGVLKRSLFVNPYLFYASIISLMATFAIIYLPLNQVFETVPLGITGYLISIFFSVLLIIIFDLLKYINNKKEYIDFDN